MLETKQDKGPCQAEILLPFKMSPEKYNLETYFYLQRIKDRDRNGTK